MSCVTILILFYNILNFNKPKFSRRVFSGNAANLILFLFANDANYVRELLKSVKFGYKCILIRNTIILIQRRNLILAFIESTQTNLVGAV